MRRALFRYSLTTLLLVVALCAVAATVFRWWQHRLTFDTPVQFDATTEQQVAVFYLGPHAPFCYDWSVLGAAHQQISVWGLPVFVERRDGDEVARQWRLPRRTTRILVQAQIHLEKGRHVLLPRGKADPGVPPHTEYQDCYFARLDRVVAVTWQDPDSD